MTTNTATRLIQGFWTAAGTVLRRATEAADKMARHAGDAPEESGAPVPRSRRREPVRLAQTMRGYTLDNLPHDIAAGVVVAALAIPMSMGYAEIVGLPAVYGLFTSIVAMLAFSLITSTPHMVFAMDSAVAAVTGSMLASTGLVVAAGGASTAMPLVSVLTGVFLILFHLVGAGRLTRFIPGPVMHGFIAGVSLTVIVAQVPGLFGTTADMSGGFLSDIMAAFGSIADANGPSTFIAAFTLWFIIHLKRTSPRVPAALAALALTTVMCAVLQLDAEGVPVLGTIDPTLPLPTVPSLDADTLFESVICALVIALVVSINSLLCLETFSMKSGTRPNGSRELLSYGVGNVAVGLFGFPPCSLSFSSTAAGASTGSRTQTASIAAAAVIATALFVFSGALYYLPRPALCAIVTVALVDVIDFDKARRYARHMLLEFAVFTISTVVVLAYGAIAGVVAGIAASLVVALYRSRRQNQQALLGVAAEKGAEKKVDPGVNYEVLKLEGRLSFLNIDARIDALLDALDESTRAVIVKLNKVDSLDSTAADKLILLVDMLHARDIHVKIVRKVRPTNDELTRYEMHRIMRGAKFYPNMAAALAGIARDAEREGTADAKGAKRPDAADSSDGKPSRRNDRVAAEAPERTKTATGELPDAAQQAQTAAGQDSAQGNTTARTVSPAPSTDKQRPDLLGGVASAAQGIGGRIVGKLMHDTPFSVQPDDRIVMTVQDTTNLSGESDLEGRLAYVHSHEAVTFAVSFDIPDNRADASNGSVGAPLDQQGVGDSPNTSPADHADADTAAACIAETPVKDKGGKPKQSKADRAEKTEKADKRSKGEPKQAKTGKGDRLADATPGKKSQRASAADADIRTSSSAEKPRSGQGTPSTPPFARLVLCREKNGETLAEYANGSWTWHCPEEQLASGIELIDDLTRSSRRQRPSSIEGMV